MAPLLARFLPPRTSWLRAALAVLLSLAPSLAFAAASGPGAMPAEPKLPTLWLVGDSTVRNGADDGQGKGDAGMWGWGYPLAAYFDPAKINVVNRALGGTSSRSFYTGNWPDVVKNLQPGDFVIMQFGHNDNNGVFTDAGGFRASVNGAGDETHEMANARSGQTEVVHTFGWYLRQYVAEARAKGATPFICSLVARKIWEDDGRLMRVSAKYFDYTSWAAEAARAAQAPFIDLHEITARRYDELGHDAVMKLFPAPVTAANGTVTDEHNHTNMSGAVLNAESVIAGLKSLKNNPLGRYFSPKAAPVAAADLTKPAPSVRKSGPDAVAK